MNQLLELHLHLVTVQFNFMKYMMKTAIVNNPLMDVNKSKKK